MTDIAGETFQVDTSGAEYFMTIVRIQTATFDTVETNCLGTFGALCFIHCIYKLTLEINYNQFLITS